MSFAAAVPPVIEVEQVRLSAGVRGGCRLPLVRIEEWERRASALWDRIDEFDGAAFIAAMRALAEDCPVEAVALFEVGGAHDSTGRTDEAIGFYRRAIAAGLDESRRRQATIQMASSLRETGRPEEGLRLLEAEASRSDEWDASVAMCKALTLAKLGRDREGLSVALVALAPSLPRYQRSTVAYAKGLLD